LTDTKEASTLAGLSLKTILVTMIGILLFGIYIAVLMYGENSLTVLKQLKEKKQTLLLEGRTLKKDNQVLQKEFFELKQLGPNI
jgi:cell division protein FtsB